MEIKDLVTFKKDLFFDGAVQADWFYDNYKSDLVSRGFVFHGPKYFGVTEKDVGDKRLIDTASFVKNLYERLYTNEDFNPFMLAIAGYGTGKSHLSVTLGKLLSNYDKFYDTQNYIINNIKNADETIGNLLDFTNKKPNFIISLNGMKDFNLNYEILKSVQESLKLYNLDNSFLKDLTTAYSISRVFLERNFKREYSLFLKYGEKYNLNLTDNDLYNYLNSNLEKDETIFNIINDVYLEINGHKIRWDEGISAGKILDILEDKLCGERGLFNKILIIFDEFGRYLEYASDFPEKSGNSALQQIFETIQNKDNNILFLGFIQSDLKNYLTRVDKTSNISRYIGRYDTSDKVYLSSNLETIFANLINKKDIVLFNKEVKENIDKNINFYKDFHQCFLQWLPQSKTKEVWSTWEKFKTVILEGIYPFNPIGIWMLSSMSEWLQNRSSLTLLHKKLLEYSDQSVIYNNTLQYISPVKILKGDLFTELLASEQDGRQRSQYCILYNNILKKYEDKFNSSIKDILSGNLILRVLRFKNNSKEDIVKALTFITTLDKNTITQGLDFLENDYGVLQYDDFSKSYDFIEDALGVRDFQIFIKRKNSETSVDLNIFKEVKLKNELGLNDVISPGFDTHHEIITNEWNFEQNLLSEEFLSENYFKSLLEEFRNKKSIDKPKGKILWIYTNKDTSETFIENIKKYENNYLKNTPILLFLLNDKDNHFYEGLKSYITLENLSYKDREKYSKFIQNYEMKLKENLEVSFNNLKLERNIIKNGKIQPIECRLNKYLLELLNELYPKIIPFPFDGFANKQLKKFKQYFSAISKTILSGTNFESIKNTTPEIKNRFNSVLIDSWKIVDKATLNLITPKNPKILEVFETIDNLIENNQNSLNLEVLLKTFQNSPYGFNDYMASLVIFTYISYRRDEINLGINNLKYAPSKWANLVVEESQINLTNIEKTTLNLIDIDLENKKILKLIKDINSNSDISLCKKFQEELNIVIETGNLSETMEIKIDNAQFKLNDGLKAYQNFEGKIRGLLSDIKENELKIDELFKISKKCDNLEELPLRYEYTSEQKQKFLQIKGKISELVEKNLHTWLKKVDCRRSEDINKFQSTMKKVATELFARDYLEESKQLNKKVENILSNISRIKELESLENNIKDFLRDFDNNCQSYMELKDYSNKIKHFEEIILNNNSISQEDELEFMKQLETPKKIINNKLEKIDLEVEEIINSIDNANNINELKTIRNNITSILNKKLSKEQDEEFMYTLSFINTLIPKIENLTNYTDRNKVEDVYINLEDDFYDSEYGMDFTEILKNSYENTLNNLNLMESIWWQEFNSIDLNGSTTELTNWLNKYESIPEYISNKTLEKIEKKKEEILNIISKNKIDYIFNLINTLNPEDKVLFKLKLKELL